MRVFIQYFLLFGLLALLAASCSSRARLAQKCNELFPPAKDSIVVKRDTLRDTIEYAPYVYFDTIPCPAADTITPLPVKIEVPGKKIYIEVPRTDSLIYRRFTTVEEIYKAELKDCESRVNSLESEVTRWKTRAETYQANAKSSGKWFWWFLILALASAATFIFRLVGKFKI